MTVEDESDGASKRHRMVFSQVRTLAARWGVNPEDVAWSLGFIDHRAHERLIAKRTGVPLVDIAALAAHPWDAEQAVRAARRGGVPLREEEDAIACLARTARPPEGTKLMRRDDLDALLASERPALARASADRLDNQRPEFSAARRGGAHQIVLIILAMLVAAVGALPFASVPIAAASFLLTLAFAAAASLRCIGFFAPSAKPLRPLPYRDLPHYLVLVPLLREGAVVQDLVRHMRALDYPSAKLDIRLLVEEDDEETRVALKDVYTPPFMSVCLVPKCLPRTKPKALNFGMLGASADLVTIYDAEDRPDPLQLRKAATHFAMAGPELACVQARLRVDNPKAGAWATLFALEYDVLFRAFVPGLQRFSLPIPLGGTSNHFRHAALTEVGGWDSYNVTEDADLGFRLLREGYRVETLDSDTWEEAPHTASAWMAQRTRWYKGWIQTWVVHMRNPGRLWADLGWRSFWTLQVLMLGMVLAAVAHPTFLLLLVLGATGVVPWAAEPGVLLLFQFAVFVLGHGAIIALAWSVASSGPLRHRRVWALAWPLYMLAHSWAVVRAMHGYLVSPFAWAKTAHGLTPRDASAASIAAERVPNRPVVPTPDNG